MSLVDDFFKIVTIGLWLVLAPAIGAIARTGTPKKS